MSRHVLNTVATALLAMSLAIRIGLPMPQTTVATVFIVMQSQAELVLAKSFYRLLGTILGALATFALAALFAQTPSRFLLAIGIWVSICTFAAAFSRQFCAYGIALTGYTAVLIGIPAIFQPGHIATDAVMRLAEVALGILCATFTSLLNHLPSWQRLRERSVSAIGEQCTSAPQANAHAASLAGLSPAIAMLATGTLWIMTSWPGGASATLNATVDCTLVALAPRPLQAALQMSGGKLLAVAVGLAIWFVCPAAGVGEWRYLALVLALALGAMLTARPERLGFGLGYSITFCMLACPDGLSAAQGAHLDVAGGIVLSVLVLVATSAALQRLAGRITLRASSQGRTTRYNSGLPVHPTSDNESRQNRSQSAARI